MAEGKNISPEKIHIREFKLVNGQVDSPFEFLPGNIKSFKYDVDFNMGFNHEEELIKADFTVRVSTVSIEPSVEAFGTYHFVFIFHVESMGEHVQISNEAVDLNPYLGNAIASISYSTSRGILMSRFQGTVMKDFILPVVDPNLLLQNKQLQGT